MSRINSLVLSCGLLSAAFEGEASENTNAGKTVPPLVLDVDTGRDDAWALNGALRNHNLRAVVVSYGNVQRDKAVNNTMHVLSLASDNGTTASFPTVWAGETKPFDPATPAALSELERRKNINGNGLCNLPLSDTGRTPVATQNWRRDFAAWLRTQEKPIDYIVCGPKTNLACLIEEMGTDEKGAPLILKHIKRVIAMGGSFESGLAVDFNYKADPAAAQKVLAAFAERVILVPFDETRKLKLTQDQIGKLKSDDISANFNKELMMAHARGWSADGNVLLHDPATLLALENDAVLETRHVMVQQDGPDAGKIVETPDGMAIRRFIVPKGEEDVTRNRILRNYMGLNAP